MTKKYEVQKIFVLIVAFILLVFGLPKTMGDMSKQLYEKEVNTVIEEQGLDRKAAEKHVNEDRKKRAEKDRSRTKIFPIFIYN